MTKWKRVLHDKHIFKVIFYQEVPLISFRLLDASDYVS